MEFQILYVNKFSITNIRVLSFANHWTILKSFSCFSYIFQEWFKSLLVATNSYSLFLIFVTVYWNYVSANFVPFTFRPYTNSYYTLSRIKESFIPRKRKWENNHHVFCRDTWSKLLDSFTRFNRNRATSHAGLGNLNLFLEITRLSGPVTRTRPSERGVFDVLVHGYKPDTRQPGPTWTENRSHTLMRPAGCKFLFLLAVCARANVWSSSRQPWLPYATSWRA